MRSIFASNRDRKGDDVLHAKKQRVAREPIDPFEVWRRFP